MRCVKECNDTFAILDDSGNSVKVTDSDGLLDLMNNIENTEYIRGNYNINPNEDYTIVKAEYELLTHKEDKHKATTEIKNLEDAVGKLVQVLKELI